MYSLHNTVILNFGMSSSPVLFAGHLAATLSSLIVATVVSTQAQMLCAAQSWNMDVLGLLLVSLQLAVMCLPYVGYHKAGGPALFPPISLANHYTWQRRALTWMAFSLLAGGTHAWGTLTLQGNPLQADTLVATIFGYGPSLGLVLLAGNPVPLHDYRTVYVAPGTKVEWLTPAAFYSEPASKATAMQRAVVRLSMSGHVLGAFMLLILPSVAGLFRSEWYTKLCGATTLALLLVRRLHGQLPIYHIARSQLGTRVMETYKRAAAAPGWKNQLCTPLQEKRGLSRHVNQLGVAEHVLLNAQMMVMLAYQHHSDISGAVGWTTRGICLVWNVGFASIGGRWWLSRLLQTATKYAA